MRSSHRALFVEAVEDRTVPSTFLFLQPEYGHAAQQAASFGSADHGYSFNERDGAYAARNAYPVTELIIRGQDGSSTILLFNTGFYGNSGGFQLIPIFVGTGTGGQGYNPAPIPTPTGTGTVGDGGSASNGGSQSDGGSFGPTPVAPTHPAASNPANPAGFTAGEVAALLPNSNTTNAAPLANQQATNAAQVAAAAANGMPGVTLVTTPTTNHAGYAITATTPDGNPVVPDDVPAPAPSAPLAPAPVPDVDASVTSGIVAVANTVVGPITGMVSFDLSGLSAGTSQFLGKVSDLAPAWPDSMPAFTDSLWVAAAALLTGGAVHAAAARSNPTKADPFGKANALSEWERRNGRLAG